MERNRVVLVIMVTVLGVIGAGVLHGGGVSAYFTDTETSRKHTFTAGTIVLNLHNTSAAQFARGARATWHSPVGWKPGDSTEVWLEMRNTGTVGADFVALGGEDLLESRAAEPKDPASRADGAGDRDSRTVRPSSPPGENDIADHIFITDIRCTRRGSDTSGNLAGWYATVLGDRSLPLTLREFVTSQHSMAFWLRDWPPAEPYLPAHGARTERLKLVFTLDPRAGGDHGSDRARFVLTLKSPFSWRAVALLGSRGSCGYIVRP